MTCGASSLTGQLLATPIYQLLAMVAGGLAGILVGKRLGQEGQKGQMKSP